MEVRITFIFLVRIRSIQYTKIIWLYFTNKPGFLENINSLKCQNCNKKTKKLFLYEENYESLNTFLKNCIRTFWTLSSFAFTISFIRSAYQPIKSHLRWHRCSLLTSFNSLRFAGQYLFYLLLRIFHKFCIGFHFGLLSGQSKTCILFSLDHSFLYFAVWVESGHAGRRILCPQTYPQRMRSRNDLQ